LTNGIHLKHFFKKLATEPGMGAEIEFSRSPCQKLWTNIESLLRNLGANVSGGRGSRVRIALNGEVINTRDVITFQRSSVDEIEQAFKDSVDDYLEFCASRGEDPELPSSGKFLVRVSPQLHRQLMTESRKADTSFNSYIEKTLKARRASA
jgi:predicted HicB family RNase H-like nuclease